MSKDYKPTWEEQNKRAADLMREPVKQAGTIDLTHSWVAILPVLIELIENSSPEGRRTAVAELNKMARAADAYNEGRG